MKCKKCGNEFEGHFCPNCGTPVEENPQETPVQPTYQAQPMPANQTLKGSIEQHRESKKKGCLTATIIVAVIIVLIAIGTHSCGNSTPQAVSSTPAKTTQAQAKSDSSEASTGKKTFKVGETVKYNDIELTVTNVKKVKGGEYDPIKAGNEYVIVTVQYKNDGKENVPYNPLDFKMKNSSGQITALTYTTNTEKTQLNSGDLAPGGNVSGDIAFEEPKGDKGLVLQYTGNIFKSESEVDFQLG